MATTAPPVSGFLVSLFNLCLVLANYKPVLKLCYTLLILSEETILQIYRSNVTGFVVLTNIWQSSQFLKLTRSFILFCDKKNYRVVFF